MNKHVLTVTVLSFSSWVVDRSDRARGRGGVLSVLAPSSRGSSVGGVWKLSTEPGLLPAAGGCPLPGVQQLVCQPSHLRLLVGELQEGLQASIQMPDRHQ